MGAPEFDELYIRHRKTIRTACIYEIKKFGIKTDLEDLCQDVWVRIIRHYHTFDPSKSAIVTWLIKVTKSEVNRQFVDSERKKRKHVAVPIKPDVVSKPDDRTPYVELKEQTRVDVLTPLIENLKPKQRKVIIEIYYKHTPIIDIAERMGLDAHKVDRLRHSGLNRLRRQLAAKFGFPPVKFDKIPEKLRKELV